MRAPLDGERADRAQGETIDHERDAQADVAKRAERRFSTR